MNGSCRNPIFNIQVSKRAGAVSTHFNSLRTGPNPTIDPVFLHRVNTPLPPAARIGRLYQLASSSPDATNTSAEQPVGKGFPESS